MALTNAFFEAVNSDNVLSVRIMMEDSLLVDPTFGDFKEMENAAASMKGLYDIHDGRGFELSEEKWDDNYMNKQMVQVVNNFSHERIEHLKDVVRHLRPVASTTQTNSTTETRQNSSSNRNTYQSYKEQKHRDQQNGRYLGAKVATGGIAGAVIGGVVASVAGVTVVGGAIAGAVVGGVTVSVVMYGGR